MKKLLYIGIALFAFVIGIITFYVRPLFMPVPLKEIDGSLALYKSREITVKGDFIAQKSHVGDFILYTFIDDSLYCFNEDSIYCFSEETLELPEVVKEKENLLIKELVEKNYQNDLENYDSETGYSDSNGFFGIDVEITGYVEERKSEVNLSHASGKRSFVIKVREIKQTSPIKFIATRKETDKK